LVDGQLRVRKNRQKVKKSYEKMFRCQEEIATGKFYSFYTGKKGGKRLGPYKGREFFCPPCAEEEKAEDAIYFEKLVKVE
jgi:hypothetical protein